MNKVPKVAGLHQNDANDKLMNDIKTLDAFDWVQGYRFEAWKDVRHLPDDDRTKQLVIRALHEGYLQRYYEEERE